MDATTSAIVKIIKILSEGSNELVTDIYVFETTFNSIEIVDVLKVDVKRKGTKVGSVTEFIEEGFRLNQWSADSEIENSIESTDLNIYQKKVILNQLESLF
jgi:hypothetical protein